MPTVTVISTSFVSVSTLNARTKGFPDLPMAIIPHPVATLPEPDIHAIADSVLSIIEKGLLEG